jgi:hypothetical protein
MRRGVAGYYQRAQTVEEAMRERCEEQGHDWRGACTIFLQVYEQCKWCGESRRPSRSTEA